MFTGYESMKGQPDTVATVDDQNISFREYQSEFNRQIEFYSQYIAGGQVLSSKQIKDFNIKQNAIKSLVNNRLSSTLGQKLGVVVPNEEIRQSVKKQEFFQTNGQFDISKYKAILRANSLTPSDYEQNVERELISSKTSTILNKFPVSKNFLNDIEGFKKQKKQADIVRLSKDEISNMVQVSTNEIKAYLSDATNMERVKSLFNERKPNLDQQEEVEARHILVRPTEKESDADLLKRIQKIEKQTNAKNFADMAKKFTEEPGGKDKGGSLGSFGRGRMVPAFEEAAFSLPVGKVSKPIKTDFGYHLILVEAKKDKKEATLAEHQNEIASELLRKTKSDQAKELIEQIANDAKMALEKNSTSKLNALQKKYKINFETDIEINRYDGSRGQVFLETAQLNKIFANEGPSLERFETAAYITFVKTGKLTESKSDAKAEDSARTTSFAYANKMRQEMLKKLGDSVSVRVYDSRIP